MAEQLNSRQAATSAMVGRLPWIPIGLVFLIGPIFMLIGLRGIQELVTFGGILWLIWWVIFRFRKWLQTFNLVRKGVPPHMLESSQRFIEYWPKLSEELGWIPRNALGHKLSLSERLAAKVLALAKGQKVENGPQIREFIDSPRGPVVRVATTISQTATVIAQHSERIADVWGVPAVTVTRGGPGVAILQAHVYDPLADRGAFSMSEFAARYPGNMPTDPLPLGITEDGRLATGTLHHTLIIGGTGSGKGSALFALIWALAPARAHGLVQFVACDPKNSEFRGRESILGKIHVQNEEIAEAVSIVRQEMERRILAATSRSFTASTDNPALVLLFDEFTSAPATFDPKEWKAVEADLRAILSKGRSLGVYVVAAGQEATKERLGLRDLFPIRIALRLASSTETDMVLGPGAAEDGALPHKIAPATPANNYRTAGIGYMLQEGIGFVSMRFPYASDAELDALSEAFTAT